MPIGSKVYCMRRRLPFVHLQKRAELAKRSGGIALVPPDLELTRQLTSKDICYFGLSAG